MYIVIFYKIGAQWFLDLPDYVENKGDPENLECIGNLHEFLQLAAENETTIAFQIDDKPFEQANEFRLIQSSGGTTGGYYYLDKYMDQKVEMEIWFNQIIYLICKKLPDYLYFRKVPVPV